MLYIYIHVTNEAVTDEDKCLCVPSLSSSFNAKGVDLHLIPVMPQLIYLLKYVHASFQLPRLCASKVTKRCEWFSLFTEYEGHPTKEPKTGCVNISVLMPVLAVAVMSLLLFIHLLVRGKRAQDNLRDGKMKHSEECSSRHSEASTSVIEEPIELQANGYVSSAHHTNGHVPRTPMNGRALSHSPGFKHSSRALVSENVTSSPVFTRMSRFHVNGQESQSPVNRLSSPRSDNELSSQTQMGDAQRQEVTPF